MLSIDEPPTVKACASCGSALSWLWSPRRNGWVSFIPLDDVTLRVHGCRELQEPSTWRSLRRGTPPTADYVSAREQLKTGNGVDWKRNNSYAKEWIMWKTSTKCDTGSCVSVAVGADQVLVRDSKHPDCGVIEHDAYGWSLILDAIKYGGTTEEVVERLADVYPNPFGDGYCWARYPEHLHFTGEEMDAFVAGVRNHEFDA